jgi:hypothetical protein
MQAIVSNTLMGAALFTMSPHPDNFYGLYIIKDLVNETMLNIDSARQNAGKVSHKLPVWWWASIGVFSKDIQ